MKTIPVCLIVVGVLVPAVSNAQPRDGGPRDPQREGEVQRGGQRQFMEAWKTADTDHDGLISKAEFAMMPRVQGLSEEKRGRLFDRLDKNRNGTVEHDEIARLVRPREGQHPAMLRLWELDVDKSGSVSFEEFKHSRVFSKLDPEKQKAVFRRLDTNRDGVISPKDRPEPPFKRDGVKPHLNRPDGVPPVDSRKDPRHIIRQLDENQDGVLSFEEFRVGPAVRDLSEDEQEDRFESLDKNNDLTISAEDFPPPAPRGESKRPITPPVPAE